MLKKINRKLFSTMLGIICIVSLYLYLTQPVSLYNIINKDAIDSISSINISASITGAVTYGLPSKLRLVIDNVQDINTIMSILNKYRYSKTLKFNNPRVVPANPTNGVIDIYIFYTTTDNKKMDQYVFIDTENDVAIRNKGGINIDYKIYGSNKSLFEDLSSWLSENWSSKKQF